MAAVKEKALTAAAMVVLGLCAAALCGWFVFHSTRFVSALEHDIDRESKPGVVSIGHLEYSPWSTITAWDVVVRDRTGAPSLRAARVHAVIDLDRFASGERSLVLPIERLEIEDFDLTLRWNRVGKLDLVDAFRSRAMTLRTTPRLPFELDLDLADIVLRRGDLRLEWPTFGFTFAGIDTGGSVRIGDDLLAIAVAALDAGESLVWFGPDSKRIAMDSVAIRDFVWEGDGFTTRLDIAVKGGSRVSAGGLMTFPEDAGIHHELALDVALSDATLRDLTQGAASGGATLEGTSKGVDLAALFTVGPATVQHVRSEAVTLDDIEVSHLAVDGGAPEGRVALDVSAGRLETGDVSAEDVSVRTRVTLPKAKNAVATLLGRIANPPQSPIAWLGSIPRAITVPVLRATRFRRAEVEVSDVDVKDLSVAATIDLLRLRVRVEVAFRDAPTALARQLLPTHEGLAAHAAQTVSGTWTAVVSATDPKHPETSLEIAQ